MYKDKDLQHHYDEDYFSGRFRPELWKRRAEFIIEKFHPSTTLDIGCSYGELVKFLNDFGADAYGIDGSEYVITQVDDSIKKKVFKVNFNEDAFPFKDNFFDFITGYYVVEHIHNFKFFAEELKRTLKQNGSAWFLTPDIGDKGRNQYDVFTNQYNEWEKIFTSYGFSVQKFSPHEMLVLKGKLKKFQFYKFPASIQNVIKKVAYDYSNKTSMQDTSFLVTKI
jgi:2-polyprenyl-3-methyl-5-hydroxy-6-metoxy-1,4-benzoquinol methylase|tara:strand:+ start:1180 stop:1848 length:669 start_codon:yes stop_codon:yes gene_type:complete